MSAFVPKNAAPRDIRELYHWTHKQLKDSGGQAPTAGTAPSTAASPGSPGTIAFDANYLYVCVATDTWKRVEILTW